jgi:biopolymer transport protein ExbD
MASGGAGTESGEPEFQIAPMIDVLLVLLIFFMSITTAEVLKIDKDIVLPVSPNAKPRDAELSKHEVAINVRWDAQEGKAHVKIDDIDYPNLPEIIPILKERIKADAKLRVVIRGDRLLPAIEIQRVMNIIGESGIADIAFAASNKDK